MTPEEIKEVNRTADHHFITIDFDIGYAIHIILKGLVLYVIAEAYFPPQPKPPKGLEAS